MMLLRTDGVQGPAVSAEPASLRDPQRVAPDLPLPAGSIGGDTGPNYSGVETAARSMRLRSPDTGVAISSTLSAYVDNGSPTPIEPRPVGMPKAVRHPAGHAILFGLTGPGTASTGDKPTYTQGASTPDGAQTQVQAVRTGNTFRAQPQPWDAGLYTGGV